MALPPIELRLVAQIAQFEANLKRAARTSEQQGDRMAAAFGVAKANLVGLLSGLSVGAGFALFKNIVDGIDSLNDLADATGASVENLSALEDVAARTGTSMDTVGSAVVKLNKTLADAKPGNDAAKALDAIGLSAKELKQLDPAVALQRIAVALSGFADDGNKARLTQELFGKSLREVAPLLKDLAESGKLNATVTTEQAKAAEDFNKQLFALQKNATDVGRALAGPIVDGINQTIAAFKQGAIEGKSFYRVIFEEQMRLLGMGGEAPDALRAARVELAAIETALKRTDITEERRASLESKRIGRLETINKLMGQQAAFKPSENYGEGYRPSAPMIEAPAGKDPAIAKRLNDYLAMTRAIAEGEEQAAKDTTEAWQAWEQIQLKEHKETTEAWALQWKQVFAEIDAEQERAIEEGAALLEKKAEESNEFIAQAARNIQDALGDSLEQAFDGSFKSIGRMWIDVLKKMAAQSAAAQLSSYLFGDTFGTKGGSLGGLIGSLFGGPRAEGGPVSAGRAYLVGERGPELIVPRSSGMVIPNGAGGQSVSFTTVVQGDASANTLRLIRQSQQQMSAQMRYRERF